MGHRHFPGSSQLFNDEHDQGWNHIHPGHPYTSTARTGTNENRSHVYPAENMSSEGMPFSSYWNSSTGPNPSTVSGHGVERPHYNPGTSCPSHVPFISSAAATFSAPHEHYVTYASSSYCNSQTWSNDSYVDLPMDNVSEAQKRKTPYGSSFYEMGSSSHYHGDRTSSDIPFPSELHMGKSSTHYHDPHYMPWLMNPSYRSNNLPSRGESSSRNVRSRPTLDLETSVDRNNVSRSSGLDYLPTHHNVEHSSSGHRNKDWNCHRHSPVPGDLNRFNPEKNIFHPATNVVNSTSGYHQGLNGNMNSTVSHGFPGSSTQSASSSRFSHRSTPTFRSSSNGLRLGHAAASSSGDRSHLVNETYPSRHLRPPPHVPWRSSDQRRSSYERFQPPFVEVAFHERFSSQGFMVEDHLPHYESRNMHDHHRDMRLDIDDMTYEDLLDLGERIGSVNTGLSNGAISSCLLEATYHPLYQTDEQRKCAICLEEYKEREELGELKGCGHEYHGGCIKKWLSMKNSCPICKSPAFT